MHLGCSLASRRPQTRSTVLPAPAESAPSLRSVMCCSSAGVNGLLIPLEFNDEEDHFEIIEENLVNTEFHPSHRIVVEHAFGRIKNRFAGIRDINVKKLSTAINMIDCSIILHNFLGLQNDVWEDYNNNDEDSEDSEDNNFNDDNDESLRRAGEVKRNWIMRKLFTI